MARGVIKSSEGAARSIKKYLDELAAKDELFAKFYANPEKSMEQCLDFICTTVKSAQREFWDDSEIYGLAVHYYQEDNPGEITEGARNSGKIVYNREVELTEEEKEQARQMAIEELKEREIQKLKEKEKKDREKAEQKRKEMAEEGVMSLFGEEA